MHMTAGSLLGGGRCLYKLKYNLFCQPVRLAPEAFSHRFPCPRKAFLRIMPITCKCDKPAPPHSVKQSPDIQKTYFLNKSIWSPRSAFFISKHGTQLLHLNMNLSIHKFTEPARFTPHQIIIARGRSRKKIHQFACLFEWNCLYTEFWACSASQRHGVKRRFLFLFL